MAKKSGKRVTSAGGQTRRGSTPVEAPPGGTPSLVVGLGASAGGLAPLQALLSNLPIGRGFAVVVVQPVPTRSDAYPLPLIAEKTKLRVVEAVDEAPILGEHVYVMPPGTSLSIVGGRLSVKDVAQCQGLRMPIDHFLCTLAADQGRRAAGVVLSGAGRDGADGLAEIKAQGGVTAAQDPGTARHQEMPQHAISAGHADAVLPPEQLAAFLTKRADEIAALTGEEEQEAGLQGILAAVHVATGHDFRCYKRGTLERRIRRRLGLHQLASYDDYARMLRTDKDQAAALRQDLMIGVTDFFRQGEAWRVLEEKVIAGLVINAQPQSTLRVWVPACATGKEAYSLAMLLAENIQRSGKKLSLQVFATDADVSALDVARAGQYGEEDLKGVSQARLRRFFVRRSGRYEIVKGIRESIVFAPQDLLSDPPFSKLDLISCRNLLIYLDPAVQKKIIQLFHFALREGGYLFMGSAETIGGQENLFAPVAQKWRIYRRLAVATPLSLDLPLRPQGKPAMTIPPAGSQRRPTLPSITLQAIAERYGPAAALVDRKGALLYTHGNVRDFLEIPMGEHTGLLSDAAREGLRNRLNGAIASAVSENKKVTVHARVRKDKKSAPVEVTVSPLRHPQEADGLLLVTFEEQRLPKAQPPARSEPAHSDARQLEDELKITREELQSTIGQLEQTNEHLKASNEEVTAANEELQSANEELETSKEELQSVNEELNTVNQRLQEKVVELEQASNDISNLLISGSIATVFLDRDLKVRRFTLAVTKLLSLVESDIGRPISDIHCKFRDEPLLSDARRVLGNLMPAMAEVQSEDGDWYLRRILPYRTKDDRIEGVAITFSNVTELKELTDALRYSEEAVRRRNEELEAARAQAENERRRLEAVMDSLPVGVAITDAKGGNIRSNSAFDQVWGGLHPATGSVADYSAYKAWWADTGKEVAPEEWASARAVQNGESVVGQMMEIRRFDGAKAFVINSASPVRDADGAIVGSAVAIQDISDLRRAQIEREVTVEFLRLVNEHAGTVDLVRAVAAFFQRRSGCQGVGIRLKDGEDYPYFEVRGFPNAFVETDNRLCTTGADGQIVRDSAGNPVLGCTCGDVICGRTDPSSTFFTPAGGFWSNCTTDLLAGGSEADRQAHMPNRCNSAGYESVALLPLRVGPERLGLLQLHDRRKGVFTADILALWQRLADHLAVALARARAEEEVARVASFPILNPQPIVEVDLNGRVSFANPAAKRLFPDLEQRGLDHAWLPDRELLAACCRPGAPTGDREVAVDERWYHQILNFVPQSQRLRIYGRDITGRKQAEEALRQLNAELEKRVAAQTAEIRQTYELAKGERQRLYNVLETLPVYVILLSKDYHVPFANRFFRERFGESHGRCCFEYLFERTEPCENCETYKVLKTHAPHHWEWTGPDGRNYDIHDFPFTDTDGSPLIMEMGIDVTEQKRAEAALKTVNETLEQQVAERTAALQRATEHERFLAEVLERAVTPFGVGAPDGTLVTFNRAFAELTGYTREELEQKNLTWAADLTPPEWREREAALLARAVQTRQPVRYEKEYLRKDGARVPIELVVEPIFDEAGSLRQYRSFLTDITERRRTDEELREARASLERRVRERTAELEQAIVALRQSEFRYRTLFETMDQGFCVVEMIDDPQGKPVDYRFVEINPTFEKHTGLQNALGRTIRELVPNHDAHWFEIYGRVARTGEACRFEDAATAMQRFYDVFAFRIGEAENPRVGILFTDITDKRRTEAALREAYETLEHRVAERTAELARSNEDLEQFAYIASHDLQEPLRMVTGFLNLLKERYRAQLDDKAVEYIGYSVDGATRMSSLIRDLLEYSRLDRKERLAEPIDTNHAVAEALANLRSRIEEAGATVTHDELPTVSGDPVQLTQVFQNLISNAVKFRSPDQPCQVHIAAERRDRQWIFSVRDNGIGIASHHQDRIFVIFQRLHGPGTYPGTGIGLALCKRIVERHGGRIWVESKAGQGATFYFALPEALAV